jgi:hypothetical protein
MPTFPSVVCPLVLVGVTALSAAPARARPVPLPDPGAAASAVERSPDVTCVRTYRMSGRIRPLLVWMGRDDVGLGRVVWRQDAAGRPGYELLIGTDPGKAPRGLNKWGFVSEQGTGDGGDLLALMTGTAVGSFAEANADAAGGAGSARLRVLRGRLAAGVTEGRVSQLAYASAPTIHDVDGVLARLRYEEAASRPASARAAAEARPGLLSALAVLVDRLGQAAGEGPGGLDATIGRPVPYVFGHDAYDLRVRSAHLATREYAGRAGVRVVDAEFEIRTGATGARTRFAMATGLDGSLAGVPLTVRWQPRWWLEVGLHLVE